MTNTTLNIIISLLFLVTLSCLGKSKTNKPIETEREDPVKALNKQLKK